MKIKIIEIDHDEVDGLSLTECGFMLGDVVEVSGYNQDGDLSVKAIRDTAFVSVGKEINLQKREYEVIEE